MPALPELSNPVAWNAALAAAATGLGLSASLIVAIGAQNTFVLRQGLRREQVTTVVATCIALDVLLMSLGVGGLAAALGEQPRLLAALALAGAAVLAAYALAALRRALRPSALQVQAGAGSGAGQGTGSSTARQVLLQTLAISLLNPHVYLDTVVLVGAVGARQPEGTRLAFLAGAGLASALWFTALGYGARLLAPVFARPAAWRVLDFVIAFTMGWLAWRMAAAVLTP